MNQNKINPKQNIYWLIAGGINLFTAILHTIGGQLGLVDPLMKSGLQDQTVAEWIGGWHIITIILFATSYLLIKKGLSKNENKETESIKFIGYLYILFSFPFIATSLAYGLLAPQWILLMPIGLLTLFGHKKDAEKNTTHR